MTVWSDGWHLGARVANLLENYIPIVIRTWNETHEIFRQIYLLLLLFISKVEYLWSGFVRLLCFERDITKKWEREREREEEESTQTIFVPCNGMYSVRVCAQKNVYDETVCVCEKNRDEEGNGILLASERDCKWHQKGRKLEKKRWNGLTSKDKRLIVIETGYRLTNLGETRRMHFRCTL